MTVMKLWFYRRSRLSSAVPSQLYQPSGKLDQDSDIQPLAMQIFQGYRKADVATDYLQGFVHLVRKHQNATWLPPSRILATEASVRSKQACDNGCSVRLSGFAGARAITTILSAPANIRVHYGNT